MSDQTTHRVLLVDDNPGVLDMLTALLERADDRLAIETATSGRAALAVLADRPVECIVTGYELSEMTGLELFAAVREDHPDVRFVLLSHREPARLPTEGAAEVDASYQMMDAVDRFPELANRILRLGRGASGDPAGQAATPSS